jgi:tRNA-dihydrouridine synthase A
MVHANAVIHGDRARLLAMDPGEHPVALQLGGSEPALLAQAARIGAEAGFDEVNLNCGCPSDRVQAGRFGACLMREPELVADAVAAMTAALEKTHGDVPVTVKCRLGVDDDHDWGRFLAFIDTIAGAGCGMFVVHARNAWLQGLSPKENREVPPLRYDWAYRLKAERPGLQVVVNGGIADAAEASAHLDHVDGAMLGRAAYHTPYLLHELDVAWFDGEIRTRGELLRAYRPHVEAQLARGVQLKHIVRHVLGLFAGQPGGRAFRQVLSEGAHKPGADWSLVDRALALTERERVAA